MSREPAGRRSIVAAHVPSSTPTFTCIGRLLAHLAARGRKTFEHLVDLPVAVALVDWQAEDLVRRFESSAELAATDAGRQPRPVDRAEHPASGEGRSQPIP